MLFRILLILSVFVLIAVNIFAQNKINSVVVNFSDATGSYAGAPVAKFISSKLASSPSYSSVLNSSYSYDNLPAALEDAKKKNFGILIGGVVTDSNVTYSDARIPSPWGGGVTVRSATATVAFQADVRYVSDGAIVFNNTYSASETVSNVGAWAWTNWGYVDVNSYSFHNSPVGKALNKATAQFIQDLENNKSRILSVLGTSTHSSPSYNANPQVIQQGSNLFNQPIKFGEEIIKLGDYEFVKVYENNMQDLPKGTAFINGMENISNYKAVTDYIPKVGRNVPLFGERHDHYSPALMLKTSEHKIPICIDLKVPFVEQYGQIIFSRLGVAYGKVNKDKNNFNGLFVIFGFNIDGTTQYNANMYIKSYLVEKGDINRDWYIDAIHIPKPNFSMISSGQVVLDRQLVSNKELHIRIFVTGNKLVVQVENQTPVNIEIPSDLSAKFGSGNVFFNGRLVGISGVCLYKLKILQEDSFVKEDTNKIDDIEEKLVNLGANVSKTKNSYVVSFSSKQLFNIDKKYGLVTKKDIFEDSLDLIDKLAIALGAPDIKIRINQKNQSLYDKQKTLIIDYLGSISNGNYTLKFLSAEENSETVVFRISR
ncbi:MAG: hypothetical protein N2169_01175 [bacterium]|nr:hypothetical protein [bacterium]